jgi:hypothetical protein
MSNMACLGVRLVRVSNLFCVFSFAEYLVASYGVLGEGESMQIN